MTGKEILQSHWLDILFENRNKLYGAYELRKNYSRRLSTAFALSIVLISALLFMVPSGKKITRIGVLRDSVVIRQLIMPKEEKEKVQTKQKIKVQQKQLATKEFISKIQIVDKEIVDNLVDQENLSRSRIDASTLDGIEDDFITIPKKEEITLKPVNPDITAPPKRISHSAQFPGGVDAWRAFLNRYLKAPEPLDPGEKRQVVVRFMVSTNGEITDFRIIESGGSRFDQEVIRVLKKMPKWTPAFENGEPVARPFNQPVTFVGIEE